MKISRNIYRYSRIDICRSEIHNPYTFGTLDAVQFLFGNLYNVFFFYSFGFFLYSFKNITNNEFNIFQISCSIWRNNLHTWGFWLIYIPESEKHSILPLNKTSDCAIFFDSFKAKLYHFPILLLNIKIFCWYVHISMNYLT